MPLIAAHILNTKSRITKDKFKVQSVYSSFEAGPFLAAALPPILDMMPPSPPPLPSSPALGDMTVHTGRSWRMQHAVMDSTAM
jgi:hypothetical protein